MKNSENEIVDIELNLEVADARAKISKLRNDIDKLTKTRDKAKNMTREQRDAADALALAEIKLAKQKIRLSSAVKKQTVEEEGSTAAVQRQIRALMAEQKQLQKNSAQYAINARKINNLSTSINVSSQASGAATSSVMELGRVISDAPYGMRGMANNLSQLTSMLFYASTAAGGFTLALKQMWKAMMGPLGLVLVITAAISALDYMSTRVDKTKKSMDDLSSTFTEGAAKLLVLKANLDSNNVSLKRKNELIALAKGEFEDLNLELDENGKLTVASTNALNDYTKQLVKTAKARAIVQLIQETQKKIAAEEGKSIQDNLAWYDKLYVAMLNSGTVRQRAMAAAVAVDIADENQDEILKNLEAMSDKYVDMLTEKNAELGKLIWDPLKDTKDPKDPKTKGSTDFSGKLLDFSVENDKIRDEEMKKTIIFEQDKLAYLHQAELRELEQKKDTYKEKETLRYNAFIKKQQAIADDVKQTKANRKVAEENISQAETEFKAKMTTSDTNYSKAVVNLKKWQVIEVGLLTKAQQEEYSAFQAWEQEQQRIRAEYKKTFMGTVKALNREDHIEKMEIRKLEIEEELAQETLALKARLALNKEYSELETKIVKTQAQIDADVFAAKKAMMNDIMDSTISIFSTMKSQQEKGSKEEKKYALLEIYAGAAKGLMNGVLIAGEASKKAGTAAPFIYAGVLATQIASVYSSVQAAKKVLAGGSPSGGSKVATPTFSPNFNVVGNSDTNQLAESISDQTNSPTRAYVVYEDIATAGVVSEQSIESSGI